MADFDDFLNELESFVPSISSIPPDISSGTSTSVKNETSAPFVSDTLNNFSIEDDDIDNLFSSISAPTSTSDNVVLTNNLDSSADLFDIFDSPKSDPSTNLSETSIAVVSPPNVSEIKNETALIGSNQISNTSDSDPFSFLDGPNTLPTIPPEQTPPPQSPSPVTSTSNAFSIFDSPSVSPIMEPTAPGSLINADLSSTSSTIADAVVAPLVGVTPLHVLEYLPSSENILANNLLDDFDVKKSNIEPDSSTIDSRRQSFTSSYNVESSQPVNQTLESNNILHTKKVNAESEFISWLTEDSGSKISQENLVDTELHPEPSLEVQSDINAILQSSFPDLQKLRKLLMEARYIPTDKRCHIWNTLLTGSSIEDLEAKYYHFKMEDAQSKNFSNLLDDVESVMKRTKGLAANEIDALKHDLTDIISLFCLRKDVDYNPLFLQLLAPLAIESKSHFPKTVISSSFYNFVENFAPLARLDTSNSDFVLDVLHFWLHLLVNYHCPKLSQHLDRVLPGWYLPCKIPLSSIEVEEAKDILKNTSHLDKLERDLGLDSIDNPFGWNVTTAPFVTNPGSTWTNVKGSNSFDNIQSAQIGGTSPTAESKRGSLFRAPSFSSKPESPASPNISHHNPDSEDSGYIAHNWIAANFAGCLPTSMALAVYDWAILYEEKYAGLFLIASLLEIYSDMLLTMDGKQIKAWMFAIASGQEDWYKLLPAPAIRHHFNVNETSTDGKSHQWKEFVAGWLHVSTAMRRKTPGAFIKALKETEDWISDATTRFINDRKLSEDVAPEETRQSAGEIEDDVFGMNSPATPQMSTESTATKANGGNFMAQLQKLRMQFQVDTATSSTDIQTQPLSESIQNIKYWPHDTYISGKSLCLWSDATEIVPCFISNRRMVTSYNMLQYFDSSIELLRKYESDESHLDHKIICLPRPEDSAAEVPFYFGIDCRTAQEKSLLGVFPRTYGLDPSLLSDSDEVTKLLETLDPLAATVHLCIFGAGEEFYRWHEAYQQTILQQQQHKKLWGIAALGKNANGSSNNNTGKTVSIAQQNISDEASKLNSVALFFLKKSFRHVSILEGGYTAALKYIYQNQSTVGLSNHLVDIDLYVVNSILGRDSNHIGTVVASHPSLLNEEENNDSTMKASSTQPSTATKIPAAAATSLANFQKASGNFFSTFSSATSNLLFNDPASGTAVNVDAGSVDATKTIESGSTASTAASVPSASATTTTAAAATATTNAKELFSGFTKKLSVFGSTSLEQIKKSVAAVTAPVDATNENGNKDTDDFKRKEGFIVVNKGTNKEKMDRQSAFVIDDEDEDEETGSHENPSVESTPNKSIIQDTFSVSVRRTDHDRQQALVLHKLAGLQKGDTIEISREYLPGAILFPCHKYKHFRATAGSTAAGAMDMSKLLDLPDSDALDEVEHGGARAEFNGEPTEIIREVHRYLVVTKERFMVLDADGGGVGSPAIVKSNHHLTELIKMTFRKKNPQLVTIFFMHDGGANKSHKYRVPKKTEFITALQKNMQRFK